MDDKRNRGGVLATILAVVAMVLICFGVFVAVAVAWEYQTNKRKSEERFIRVMKKLEEAKAKRFDAELSGDAEKNP